MKEMRNMNLRLVVLPLLVVVACYGGSGRGSASADAPSTSQTKTPECLSSGDMAKHSNSGAPHTEPVAATAPRNAGSAAPGPIPGLAGSEGGRCSYRDVDGTATIKVVRDAPDNENNCSNPVRVEFEFIPKDPAATPQSRNGTVTVYDGKNPPRSCLQPTGIRQGASFRAKAREISSGTCTPVLFELQIPNLELCQKRCFGR